MKCTYEGVNYRTIPSEQLDNNIPQGRGMIKWAPFATMPEQYENVDRLMEEQSHVPAPNLNTDQWQHLELKLRECIDENVILRYWQAGHEFIIECTLVSVDDWSESVTAIKDGNILTIEFRHIYSVDRYDYMSNLD